MSELMIISKEILDEIEQEIKGKKGVKFSIGVLKDGKVEKYLIGENGLEPFQKYYYEIGSITKTFTGLLVAKAIEENKIKLEDSISAYIPGLDESKYYPTIRRLVTHTSGCNIEAFEDSDDSVLLVDNPFLHITRKKLLEDILSLQIEDKDYPFKYSNFGSAIIGYVLENVYQTSYDNLIKNLLNELGLNDTYGLNPPYNLSGIGPNGEAGQNWLWTEESAYNSAGYLVSTLDDMLKYAQIQIDGTPNYVKTSHISNALITSEGARQEIGIFWLVFPTLNSIFHNGGTGCFNSGICINPKDKIAVVALSNCYTSLVDKVIKWVRTLAN